MSLKSLLLGGVVLSTLIFAENAANAQTAAADESEAIIVTGSRIRQDPLNQRSPVVTVDETAIDRTGLTSIADVLQRIPSAAGGLNTKTNNAGNIGGPPDGTGVSSGSAEIDLRYLGAKRTLVLVDGMRYVNGSAAGGIPASVDLNSIPQSMIERVEVLQSGASPLYGSDAIAGVVNIITKQSQQGLDLSGQFGTFRHGDGHTYDFNASYGIQSDVVSIVFGGNYVKQEGVSTANRAISQAPTPGFSNCLGGGCSSAIPNGRYDVQGESLTLISPVIGRAPTLADYRDYAGGTVDGFNFAPYNYLLTPSERYGGFVNFKAELSDNVNFRTRVVYQHRGSTTQAAFLPLFIGPDAGNGNLLDTISIDVTNPYNPFGETLSPENGNYSTIRRRFVEGGPRTFTQSVDTLTVASTLDGSFDMGDHKWYWDVNGIYGINDAHQIFTGNLNAARLAQALGPVADCTGACVPFNIFGGVGSITQPMLDYVTFDEKDKSKQQLWDFTANLSGDLFDLPAGAVGVAIGYEHRSQRASYDPDPVITAGLGADVPTSPSFGSFNVDEFYGEIRVPILSDTPFFQKLELDGAARHSNYSSFGSNTTYTLSALWKPASDLLLRGGYAESLRAPSIGELYAGPSRTDATETDPCTSAAGGLFTTNATVRANCIANGVPDPSNLAPGQNIYAEEVSQIGVFSKGSTTLKPETAKTWTAGAVYSPAWARENFASAFSLELNYYNIELKNAIASVPALFTLQRCYLNSDPLSCASITRTPSGSIASISGVLQNLSAIKTSGLDGTLIYRSKPIGDGTFGINLNAAYLIKYDILPPADLNAPTQKCVKTERCTGTDQAYPRLKLTGTVDWSTEAYGISFTGRYISKVDELDGVHAMGNVFYGDMQAYVAPGWMDNRARLTIGVNNIFNKAPPPCFTCDGANFDTTTYDVPGQFGYVRLTYKM
ncbi:TonB-dependent receptor [Sphingobium phenoxybenzoativorans]|uniref:TonB-dependent receptor n=1 Tax=Sphingobium phenoxybenzoativorans TaxID=1592790 RepID=A0A975K8X9_9SPHN|nr:TonB-dependent receptor [Sphingobium phenoxybenzoativorans]QUT06544.1 TonB-dependent receptor [Sphingobium phenoxybenzoativorans]